MLPESADHIALGKSNLILDLRTRALYRDGVRIHLSNKPYEVLVLLVNNRGRIVGKQEILESVWGEKRELNVVEQAIRQIRLGLGDDSYEPKFIETVPGRGYRFIPAEDAEPGETVTAARNKAVSRRWLIAGAAGVVVAGAAAVAGSRWLKQNQNQNPEKAVLTGSLLTVLDGLGRTLWTHRFAGRYIRQDDSSPWDAQVVDLQGKGRPGVLATCNFVTSGSADRAADDGQLFYFDADGNQQWSIAANPQLLDFKGRPFERAWNFSQVLVTPVKGGYEIWAGVRHGTWWPGALLHVDAQGTSRVQFASAGQINRLAYLKRGGEIFIAFCGENNAFGRPSAGLVRIGDAPAKSPLNSSDRYRFSNAPGGDPRSYVLFPNTELASARQKPYGHATDIYSQAGGFSVNVDNGDISSCWRYELTGELEPRFVYVCDSYPKVHDALQQRGIVQHAWKNCPEIRRPVVVSRYQGGVWRDWNVDWRLPV